MPDMAGSGSVWCRVGQGCCRRQTRFDRGFAALRREHLEYLPEYHTATRVGRAAGVDFL